MRVAATQTAYELHKEENRHTDGSHDDGPPAHVHLAEKWE